MVTFDELAVNPFTLEIQSRLADTDSLLHINNAAFVEFLETARTRWHSYVRDDPKSLDNWDWILGGINITFRKEAFLSDQMTCLMWCSNIGNSSWDFSYALINQDDELILEARTSQIMFDYKKKKTIPISEDVLKDLESRLGKPWPETT